MNFLNPMVLWALPAIGLPVAIHLINKIPVREKRWAAMRFLLESVRENRRRLRLEDLLLLAMRCLLVAAAVLAFTRPVLRSVLPTGSVSDGPVAAMILLDNSASMGQSDGVETRFERAKKAIGDRLDQGSPNSSYGLLLISNQTEALLPNPTADFAQFRHSLDLAQLSDRGSDLAVGIRAAYGALKGLGDRPREIDVYTDGQTYAWARQDEIRRMQEQNPGVRLLPVLVGKRGEDNLGVTGLASEGSALAINQPCRFKVEVSNYGARPVEGVRVTLAIDGAAPSDETLIPRIDAGATQAVGLLVRFPTPGDHAVTAAIPADRLTIDNQRSVAVNVSSRVNALVLEGSSPAAKIDRDGLFLANALAPYSRDRAGQSYLSVTLAPVSSLNGADLAADSLVCLCNPGDLPAGAGAALRTYVLGGGNLIVFPGPQTNPERWRRQDPAFWSLLPASLGEARPPGATTPPLHWQAAKFDHPITALWNDPEEGNLGSIQATGYFPLTLRAAADNPGKGDGNAPAVIVHYANGDPAAAEWLCGKGSVVLFSSTATPQWTDLPLHPTFVALVQRLLGYLSRRNAAPLSLSPGGIFQTAVPIELLGQEFSLQRPGPDKGKHLAGQVELDNGQAIIRYTDTEAVGAYRLFVGQESAPRAVFAIQLDPAESDLRQIAPGELASLTRASEEQGGPAPAASPSAPRLTVTRQFWTLLVWMAGGLALLELALAQRFSRSR
jgi:hypothetical protein